MTDRRRGPRLRRALALALACALAHPAAADRAVLAGVPAPDTSFWGASGASAADLLRDGGFTVLGSSGDVGTLRTDLLRLMQVRAEGARIVIHLDGHFVRSQGQTWYLGAAPARTDLVRAGQTGLLLDTVLEIAAMAPGGAFVLLGQRPGTPAQGPGLRAGLAPVDAPQGVTVIAGSADMLARLAQRRLYQPGADLRAEVSDVDGLRLQGFAPPGHAIVTAEAAPAPSPPDPLAPTDNAQERAFWDSVRAEDTESAYRDYLQRYPAGQFRAQATQALEAIVNDPVRLAQQAEAALNLTRADRRRIQTDLNTLGYDTRGIDGIFGGGTRSAVRSWQDSDGGRGFAVTGYLDAIQIDRLARQAGDLRAQQAQQGAQDDRLWQRIGGTQATLSDLRTYLARFPQGQHAQEARDILDLAAQIDRAPTDRGDRADWIAARRTDSAQGYRTYLDNRPRGYFVGEARSRLGDLSGADRDAARNEENDLGLNVVTRILIERRLTQLDLPAGPVDGFFTAETRRALELFQRDRGLPVTGYVTEQTVTQMLAEIGISFSRD